MKLEQRLRVALAACEPGPEPLSRVMAQLSAARPRPAGKGRRGRIIIASSLLALAVAAGMLVSRLVSTPAQVSAELPATAGGEVAAVPEQPVTTNPVTAEVTAALATNAVVEAPTAKPAETPQPAPGFTVLVQPLQLDTQTPAARTRAQQYFEAFLEELRTVPDLILLGPVAGGMATARADFRITVVADDTRDMDRMAGRAMWQMSVHTEAWRGGAYRQEPQGNPGSGGTLDTPACPQGTGQPVKCGPAADAARAVTSLMRVFPATPALTAQLRARNSAEAQARSASGDKPVVINVDLLRPGAVAVMDAQVIRTILERIANVPAPETRAVLWSSLRGQRQSDVHQNLLQALREDTAETVRREVITQLALGFPDDPGTRAALAEVAAGEPSTLSVQIARRALLGDEPWRAWVATTVRDTSLPATQRLEPLNWMIGAAQLDPRLSVTFNDMVPALLEGEGARILADLLASRQKQAATMLDNLGEVTLLARLGAADHPAVAELLIANFDATPSEIALRFLAQRRGDARVRGKLQAIAAATDEVDPKLRQLAASLLQQAVPSPQVGAPGN